MHVLESDDQRAATTARGPDLSQGGERVRLERLRAGSRKHVDRAADAKEIQQTGGSSVVVDLERCECSMDLFGNEVIAIRRLNCTMCT